MIIHEEPSPNSVSSPVSTAKDSRCYTVEGSRSIPHIIHERHLSIYVKV